MEDFKTPLPVPEFYTSSNTSYSTKKSRRVPPYRRIGPPPLTAPPGCYSNRFSSQKPHRISFKLPSEKRLSLAYYDESKQESYFKQCFIIESKLGEGCFGQVYKARSKEDNQLYAVKRAMEPFRNESDRAARLSEVHKHESLPRHPNLVRFIKAWEERGRLYIQTELCKMSLSELCESIHDIPESLIWRYLVDLLLAVKHLHDHDLIHMDIKPDNIFISDNGICKLGDFGLVCDLKKDMLDDVVEGDSKYLAPEVLDNRIGKHVDIFSLGITILEISSDLDLPSEGPTWHMLREGRLPEEFLSGKSSDLRHVIRLMLTSDEAERPSAAEILALPSVINVWRWRRKFVAYSQISTVIRSCLTILWMYFVAFGRTKELSKTFMRLAKRRMRAIPPRAIDYEDMAGVRYYDDELTNGNVTKELKLDSASSDDESAICDLSAIHRDDNSIMNKSFSTPPADVLDDMHVPDFCSSPEDTDFDQNFVKERSKAAARPFWNSTPASENRMRRRIVDVKSPNDLKRLRGEKQLLNFTSSPVRLSRIINQQNSSSDSSGLISPYTMPDIRCGVNRAFAATSEFSISRPRMPPKNLLDAFEAESETEVEL